MNKFNRFLIKGRNIIYYMRIDSRPRSQYLRVVRDWRDLALELYRSGEGDANILKEILDIIPSKVSPNECRDIMEVIREKIYYSIQFPDQTSINPYQCFDE